MAKPTLVLINGVLRLADHAALYAAAEDGKPVIPVFIYDPAAAWALGGASRWWLKQSLESLSQAYENKGSNLVLRLGDVAQQIEVLVEETQADSLYLTRSYTPAGVAAEQRLQALCQAKGVALRRFSGQLLLEPEEVRTGAGKPYSVFTPFWRQAKTLVSDAESLPEPLTIRAPVHWPLSHTLADCGLDPEPAYWAEPIARAWDVGEGAAHERLASFLEDIAGEYEAGRDRPGRDGTSRLSAHLAFGEISPRQIWHKARAAMTETNASGLWAFLREIGWREFNAQTLFYNPSMPDTPLKQQFTRFPWKKAEGVAWTAWTQGMTGYPIVDAGMRQLWQTGWMHNRVRMIVASFLVKDLLIDWRAGETWFWDTLVDADLANNAAGWQWVAGCGADASPYFRIFNPVAQGEKFDTAGDYIRAFVPELAGMPAKYIHRPFEAPADVLLAAGVTLGETYPNPIVDRRMSRERALAALASIKT